MTTAADMITFRDRVGHSWRPVVDDGMAERVRRELDLDLARVVELEPEQFAQGIQHPVERFPGLLYRACEKQIEAEGLRPESFVRCLDPGRVWQAAFVAVALALIEWRPQSRIARELGPALIVVVSVEQMAAGYISEWFKQ